VQKKIIKCLSGLPDLRKSKSDKVFQLIIEKRLNKLVSLSTSSVSNSLHFWVKAWVKLKGGVLEQSEACFITLITAAIYGFS
jgi:hypothetical protein